MITTAWLAPLLLAAAASAAAPATPAPAGKVPEAAYGAIDLQIGELNKNFAAFNECVSIADFLADSAEKTQKKLRGPKGEVPSHMAGIIPTKRKMADNKRASCVAQSLSFGSQIDAAMQTLASMEPRSAKGVTDRRNLLKGMRLKLNAALKRMGGKGPAAQSGDSSEEEGK